MNRQHRIAYFFLVFFISFKAVSFHAVLHDADHHMEDCQLCEFAHFSNHTPLQTDTNPSEAFPELICYSNPNYFQYNSGLQKSQTENSIPSRAPPTVISC